MTAKNLRKEGGTGCTVDQGLRTSGRRIRKKPVSNGQNPERRIRRKPGSNSRNREGYNINVDRAIRRILKYRACKKALSDAVQKRCDAEEEHYGRLRDPVVHTAFEERQFGDLITHDRASRDLPCSVVAIALFDGDKMLFACSGLPLPRGTSKLQLIRYVTSACLATEYERKRYRDDKLRVVVRLPNGKKKGGFIELHNNHIAIVTLLDRQAGRPMDAAFQAEPPSLLDEYVVVGRAFESGCLMSAKVKVVPFGDYRGFYPDEQRDVPNSAPFGDGGRFYPSRLELDAPYPNSTMCSWRPVSSYEHAPVALLGGLVLQKGSSIIGMSVDIGFDGASVSFLAQEALGGYLKHFRIFEPKVFRQHSWPSDVYTVHPSAFISKIYRLRHLGYPMPPPLMLELNGKLHNQFEDFFGDVRAWKGYPFGSPNYCDEPVWRHLRKDVVKDISRRVVSIASFSGYERYFACTGLLVKWHRRIVVLTSANLVRRCNNEDIYDDKIDNELKIEVFLPPKQRASGKLEFYSSKYNIAIVSFEKKFISVCPEDISSKYSTRKSSGKVVAVGSDPLNGLLMASIGKVKPIDMDCKLACKDLKLSTCKIKKAGIGGPLINLDGSFVGMNFFDGRNLTPFLPRSKIVQVLRSKINLPLPSERGVDVPVHLKGAPRGIRSWWPVPEPYWYHGLLDVDRAEHKHVGRVLQ